METKKKRIAWNRKSLVGKEYGRLTVIGLDENKTTNRKLMWLCVCSCGKNTSVQSGHLTSGHTQSCGCLVSERSSIIGKKNLGVARINDIQRIESAWNTHYRNLLNQARCRGIKVDLTLDQVKELSMKNCIYCNKEPELKKQVSKKKYGISDFCASGIDRVDTTQHYYMENCVPCCYNCNREKGYITPKMVYDLYHMLDKMGIFKGKIT